MTTVPDSDFIALQSALAGEYSLDREIGRGGMGIVYLAREVRLARPVAIKVLPPALATKPELRAAFLRESQTVARLNHPNIVPVHAAGERGGFVYIVMAYVEGITLGERIRTRGPLLPGQAARMLREVAWALAYAHAAGIVHRDVTAENILLERGTDRAIVMDFGIASAMQTAAIGDDGRVMGNAHYVSPEQAVGEPMDARSDLYSLGVCGFYALTGRLPFDADSPENIVAMHLSTPAPLISRVANTVPPRLAQSVDRCLEKDASLRYRTAEAFAESIDLAFEHAREIPIPLRVWISQGQKETGPRAMLVLWGTVIGGFATAITHNPAFMPAGMLGAGAISCLPIVTRLRRVLKEGYIVDDLHGALREHELIRSEELTYERRGSSAALSPALRVMLIVSASSWTVQTYMVSHNLIDGHGTSAAASRATMLIAAAFAVVSTMGLAGQFLLQRLAAPITNLKVGFWKGKWGARLAKLAGVGLKPSARQSLATRQLTEVALGRATDLLFQALPAALKRELAELPGTVRRLEQDATKLRANIESLDDHLLLLERGGRRGDAVEGQYRDARAHADANLAATVAALENIRLDLLRLQMGSGGVESVTASLEAAQRVGDRINEAVAAREEVDRFLLDTTTTEDQPYTDVDDDADTPVEGVPATRG